MPPLVPRSILVATALGETSDPVVATAGALAAAADAELHVLHAFDFPVMSYGERLAGAGSTFAADIREAEEKLAAQLRRTVPPEVRIASREVVIFVAHRAIIERAAVVSADLVVIGPHRDHPVADALLGSTADHVVRTSEVPCLIARGTLRLPLREILAPVDLSASARRALEVAIGWGSGFGGEPPVEVCTLHVIPPVFRGTEPLIDPDTIAAELEEEIDAVLTGMGSPDGVVVRHEVVCCDAPVADEIVRMAEEDGTDLVVLATHGYGALARALIGSIASAVARRAPCPVLLVPPRMWMEDGEPTDGRAPV